MIEMKELLIEDGDYEVELWEHNEGMMLDVYNERDDKYTCVRISFDDVHKIKEFINNF